MKHNYRFGSPEASPTTLSRKQSVTFGKIFSDDGEADGNRSVSSDEESAPKVVTIPCSHCKDLVPQEEILKCPCMLESYCSVTCQSEHWETHRNWCSGAKQRLTVEICSHCRTTSTTLNVCRCLETYYCSPYCQRKNWQRHKHVCMDRMSKNKPPTEVVFPPVDATTQSNIGPRKSSVLLTSVTATDVPHDAAMLSKGSAKMGLSGNTNGTDDDLTPVNALSKAANPLAPSSVQTTVPSVGDDAEDDFVIDLSDATETRQKSRIQGKDLSTLPSRLPVAPRSFGVWASSQDASIRRNGNDIVVSVYLDEHYADSAKGNSRKLLRKSVLSVPVE